MLLLLLLVLLLADREEPRASEHHFDRALLQPMNPGTVLRVELHQGW